MRLHQKKKPAAIVSVNAFSAYRRTIRITNNCNPYYNSSQRTVGIILTYIKSSCAWVNDILTLVDSGGCESCMNTSFAYTNNFTIFNHVSTQKQSPAISAAVDINFDKNEQVEIKLGFTYTT